MTNRERMHGLPCEIEPLSPFGRLLRFQPDGALPLESLPVEQLKDLVLKHRLILLRGISPVDGKEQFSDICRQWGKLLDWSFGTVFEVVEHEDPTNYLFTSGSVPYHWDGAFATQVPWLQFFHCRDAPGQDVGGETLFCDTAALWNSLPAETQALWKAVDISYMTEKVSHYGGVIRAPLVAEHPRTRETVIRFAEPANETTVPLNTPELEFHGISQEDVATLLSELVRLFYDSRFVYSHQWRKGDFLVADNHVLLHGRSAYRQHLPRCLWRVHIL